MANMTSILVVISLIMLRMNSTNIIYRKLETLQPTLFPSFKPTKTPTIVPISNDWNYPNDDADDDIFGQEQEEEQDISSSSPENESKYAVYSLLLVTICVILVIVSTIFYKQCLNSPSNNGYETPAEINQLEEGDESNSEQQEIAGSPPYDGRRDHYL